MPKCLTVAFVLLIPTLSTAEQAVTLTVTSNPPSATVYVQGRKLGVTPAKIKWTIPTGAACSSESSFSVRWISGAESTLTPLTICAAQGKQQQIAFQRPVGIDGIEADVQYAIYLEQVAEARRQARLAILRGLRPPPLPAPYVITPPRPRPPQRVTCYSDLVGQTVITTCQ